MRKFGALLALIAAVGLIDAASAPAQTAADSSAIVATALDYIDGFYTSDAARMERALHPELAKRIVGDPAGPGSRLQNMSAQQLIDATAGGGAARIPDDAKKEDVSILDVYHNIASVRIDAGVWIDYLHVARWNGEWKIINVLWEMAPRD
ncbi:MAG: nuclear transport factor 2 family protein [marine benthic group bacterium]|nr:nuclear transport factor 2 family protein [Gemmatimonadota bacterium]